LQKTGEVIYMPHFIEHVVYNEEFSLAVGENFLVTTALEEAVVSLSPAYKKELFAKMEEKHLLERMRAVEGQTRSQKSFKPLEHFDSY
jgi:hypothetical protein